MIKKVLFLGALALVALPFTSCTETEERIVENTIVKEHPATILQSTPWITTKVTNITDAGRPIVIPNDVAPAPGFVGYAYYKTDGVFGIYPLGATATQAGSPARSNGSWFVSTDGRIRTLTFLGGTGVGTNPGQTPVGAVRNVAITELTNQKFTYTIDITFEGAPMKLSVEHVPTTVQEPR